MIVLKSMPRTNPSIPIGFNNRTRKKVFCPSFGPLTLSRVPHRTWCANSSDRRLWRSKPPPRARSTPKTERRRTRKPWNPSRKNSMNWRRPFPIITKNWRNSKNRERALLDTKKSSVWREELVVSAIIIDPIEKEIYGRHIIIYLLSLSSIDGRYWCLLVLSVDCPCLGFFSVVLGHVQESTWMPFFDRRDRGHILTSVVDSFVTGLLTSDRIGWFGSSPSRLSRNWRLMVFITLPIWVDLRDVYRLYHRLA